MQADLVQHPVPMYAVAQRIPRHSRRIQVVDMHTDCLHPVTKTVIDPGHRQVTAIARTVAAHYRDGTGTVLQQAQIAFAGVEQVIFKWCHGQIQIQPGQCRGVQVNADARVEFFDKGPQALRAHAKKHPVDFVAQGLDHIGDQLQVTGMARASGPADPGLARSPACAWRQACPPLRVKAVLDHMDLRVKVAQGLCQRFSGHHKTIGASQAPAQRPHDVLGYTATVDAFQRNVGVVVVQLIDLEDLAEGLDFFDRIQALLLQGPLHDQGIRGIALQLHQPGQTVD